MPGASSEPPGSHLRKAQGLDQPQRWEANPDFTMDSSDLRRALGGRHGRLDEGRGRAVLRGPGGEVRSARWDFVCAGLGFG